MITSEMQNMINYFRYCSGKSSEINSSWQENAQIHCTEQIQGETENEQVLRKYEATKKQFVFV